METIKKMPLTKRQRLRPWIPALTLALGVTLGYYGKEYQTQAANAAMANQLIQIQRSNKAMVERERARAVKVMALIKRSQIANERIISAYKTKQLNKSKGI